VTWTFEWRRAWSDVWDGPFERAWRRMFEASGSAQVYHHPSLVRAWTETCGTAAGHAPMMGLARSHAGTDVLLPWVVAHQRGTIAMRRRLEPAGQDLFGYHDPLTAAPPDGIDWSVFWQAVRSSTSPDCDQALFRFVHGEFAARSDPGSSETSPVLAAGAFADFDALLAACSSNHRGEIRRRRRRLAERGAVALWTPDSTEADAALADWRSNASRAYRDVWSARARHNTVLRDGFDRFAERVVAQGLREGWAHYAALSVGGERIAWHLGLADRERLYWWIPVHRIEWEAYAPGKVLLAALVERLCERRWREIHFMTGGHAYKLAWRPALADLRIVRWHARGLRGSIFALYDRARQTV
jgi:CelD/BcsL family acetyltransferase involved in cellulose biosynthesis